MDIASFALLALVALGVGLFIGISGVGGVLLIPAMIYAAGLSVHQAVATALASFFFIGSAGTWLFARRGTLQWRLIWPVCTGAVLAGYGGARLAAQIDARALALVIGLLIVGASVLILRPPRVLLPGQERTAADVQLFRERGIRYLVTTTPVLEGRSFGTNMMEAALVAVAGKGRKLTTPELVDMIARLGFKPQLHQLN